MERVAVYGTLRRGEPLHQMMVMAGATFVGTGLALGFDAYIGNVVPVAVIGGQSRLAVELFDVGREGLRLLDGVERGYKRVVCEIEGSEARAWLYAVTFEPLDMRRISPDADGIVTVPRAWEIARR